MRWRERIAGWEARIRAAGGGGDGSAPLGGPGEVAVPEAGAVAGKEGARVEAEVRGEAGRAGLVAMPVRDQMRFQWAFIRAGLAACGLRGATAEFP